MTERAGKFIIGLTGNIATGKSAVLQLAAERGALTLDADHIVHHILDGDPSMQAAIAVAFGDHLRREDGSIDRAALGALVFGDAQALRDLEHILHPAVRVEVGKRIKQSTAPVVMVEAIKLLEGELADLCDQIWVTRCPRSLQEQRLIICRGMDAATAAMRIDAQNPQEAKVARAHVVIDTNGTMAHTREQFDRAWQKIPGLKAPKGSFEQAKDRQRSEQTERVAAPPAQRVTQKREAVKLAQQQTTENVLVRRARPSDIPALMLLMRRASGGQVTQTRSEMLRSFAERSYLIGQIGTEIVSVVGWNTDSTTAVCVDQFYAFPAQAISTVGPTMLEEIESSARVLICEVILVFLAQDAPLEFAYLLQDAGFAEMRREDMHRAWRQIVEERQPQDSVIMGKVLRDIRVA